MTHTLVDRLRRMHEVTGLDVLTEAAAALDYRWIPVSERLPEFRKQDELICWGDDIALGAYYEGRWCYWSGAWKPFGNQHPTHWMPLPEPPQ
jgi:hypothetical protein